MKLTQSLIIENILDTKEQIIAIEINEFAALTLGYGTISFDPQHAAVQDKNLAKLMLYRIYDGHELTFQAQYGIAACESAWNHKPLFADNCIVALPGRLDPDALAALWVIYQRQSGRNFSDLTVVQKRQLELIAAHDCRRMLIDRTTVDASDTGLIAEMLKNSVTYMISNYIGICNNKATSLEEKLEAFGQELSNPTEPRFFNDRHVNEIANLAKSIVYHDHSISLATTLGSGLLPELLYLFTPTVDTTAILHLPEFKGFNGQSEPINKFSLMIQNGSNHPGFVPFFKQNIAEVGWGGSSSGIIESPMTASSTVQIQELIVLTQHYYNQF